MLEKVDPGYIGIGLFFLVFCVYWIFEDNLGIPPWVDVSLQTLVLLVTIYVSIRQGKDLKGKQEESFKQFARERYRCLKSMNEAITTVRLDVSNVFQFKTSRNPQNNSGELSLLKRCDDLFRRLDDQVEKDMESWNDYAPKEVRELHQELVEKKARLRESLDSSRN